MPLKRHLARDITIVLVLKVAIILIAGFTIFGSHNRVRVDAEKMARHLTAVDSPQQQQNER